MTDTRIAFKAVLQELQKEGTVTSSYEAVNYLFETFAMDDIIAETDAFMICFTLLLNKSPSRFVEALWRKDHFCNELFDQYEQKDILL